MANPPSSAYFADRDNEWRGSYFFVQFADPQLGFFDIEKPEAERRWQREIDLCKKLVDKVNAMQPAPAFVVCCGDMVDAFPGTMHYEAQASDFIDVFSGIRSDIPRVCCAGNHDTNNTPTPESLAQYRNRFGNETLAFHVGGVRYLCANSQLVKDPSGAPDDGEAHERWLNFELDLTHSMQPTHSVLFMHYPIFLKTVDEADDYFNFKKEARKPFLDRLCDSGVSKVFCGHYHRNTLGWYNDLEMVTTSALGRPLGDDPSGIRLVGVGRDGIGHRYYAIDDVPTRINVETLISGTQGRRPATLTEYVTSGIRAGRL